MALKTWNGTTDTNPATAANWTPSGQPGPGDDVILTGSNAIGGGSIVSSGTVASLVTRGYTGTIGLPDAYLVVPVATSGRVVLENLGQAYIDFGASQTDLAVVQTAPSQQPSAGLIVSGSDLTDIHVYGPSSVLMVSGEITGTLRTYSADAYVRITEGVTIDSYAGPGAADLYGACSNIHAMGRDVKYFNAANLTNCRASNGATVHHETGANITNATAESGGRITANGHNGGVTVTTPVVRGGGIIEPGSLWTFTNKPAQPYQLVSV